MSDMKKLRILFYKTPWKLKAKYWLNWLISARTWSKYSHCEAWTAEEDKSICWPPAFTAHFMPIGSLCSGLQVYGKCWTATMRGDDNGTVVRDASGVLDHPERWVYFEIEVEAERYDTCIEIMKMAVENNNGYSKWDCLKFVSPIHFPQNDKYICSEFVIWILWWAGISKVNGIVSPGYIYKMLTKMGYEAKELAQ